MKLFERVIELTIGDTKITGLDIAFEIEKDLSPEPNPCHVEIYNLSLENRSTISKYKRVPVTVKAGYKDAVGLVFKGDMLSCSHRKEDASWKTILASGDGANAIQSARLDKSYAKGTPVKTVMKDLADKLQMPYSSALKELESFNDHLSRGFMLSGNPMAELTRLMSARGFTASVQDKTLQILKKGQALPKQALSLSAESGLLATPEIGSKGEIILKTVFLPELVPGLKVKLSSSSFNGFAIIQKVRFCGDNFGDNWDSEVEVIAD